MYATRSKTARDPGYARVACRDGSIKRGSTVVGHGDAKCGFQAGDALPDFIEGAVVEHLHTLFAGTLAKLIQRHALLNKLSQPGRDADDLEDADPAAIAQAAALQTALEPIENLARGQTMSMASPKLKKR
jgi:hypothetical protein